MVSSPEDLAAGQRTGPADRRAGPLKVLALAIAGALVGIGAFALLVDRSDDDRARARPPGTPPTTTQAAGASEVFRIVGPSLVEVRTDRSDIGSSGLGSGVVVSDRGEIITAHHVVAGATHVEVAFSDGATSDAMVIGADPDRDIAILRASSPPRLIVPATLGGAVAVGDDVFPLGSPLGFTSSITAGVVSGLGRSIERENGAGLLDGLIQFDAAINSGSSGGPLVNREGQVVGIVTALANPSQQRTFIGLGFAVPIATASAVAGDVPR